MFLLSFLIFRYFFLIYKWVRIDLVLVDHTFLILLNIEQCRAAKNILSSIWIMRLDLSFLLGIHLSSPVTIACKNDFLLYRSNKKAVLSVRKAFVFSTNHKMPYMRNLYVVYCIGASSRRTAVLVWFDILTNNRIVRNYRLDSTCAQIR